MKCLLHVIVTAAITIVALAQVSTAASFRETPTALVRRNSLTKQLFARTLLEAVDEVEAIVKGDSPKSVHLATPPMSSQDDATAHGTSRAEAVDTAAGSTRGDQATADGVLKPSDAIFRPLGGHSLSPFQRTVQRPRLQPAPRPSSQPQQATLPTAYQQSPLSILPTHMGIREAAEQLKLNLRNLAYLEDLYAMVAMDKRLIANAISTARTRASRRSLRYKHGKIGAAMEGLEARMEALRQSRDQLAGLASFA